MGNYGQEKQRTQLVAGETPHQALHALVRLLARSAAAADFEGDDNERNETDDKTSRPNIADGQGSGLAITDVRKDGQASN